jgi:hypothetical protein
MPAKTSKPARTAEEIIAEMERRWEAIELFDSFDYGRAAELRELLKWAKRKPRRKHAE